MTTSTSSHQHISANQIQSVQKNIEIEPPTIHPIAQKEGRHRESLSYDFFDCDEETQESQEIQESQTTTDGNKKHKETAEECSKQKKTVETRIAELETLNTVNQTSQQDREEDSPQMRYRGSRRRNAILSFGAQDEDEHAETFEMMDESQTLSTQNPVTKLNDPWKCQVPGCEASFKSAQALKGHKNVCGKNYEMECPNEFCVNRAKEPGKRYKGLKGLNIHRKKCDQQQPKQDPQPK